MRRALRQCLRSAVAFSTRVFKESWLPMLAAECYLFCVVEAGWAGNEPCHSQRGLATKTSNFSLVACRGYGSSRRTLKIAWRGLLQQPPPPSSLALRQIQGYALRREYSAVQCLWSSLWGLFCSEFFRYSPTWASCDCDLMPYVSMQIAGGCLPNMQHSLSPQSDGSRCILCRTRISCHRCWSPWSAQGYPNSSGRQGIPQCVRNSRVIALLC